MTQSRKPAKSKPFKFPKFLTFKGTKYEFVGRHAGGDPLQFMAPGESTAEQQALYRLAAPRRLIINAQALQECPEVFGLKK